MKINELKRNLKESTKEQLIKDIADLFKKNSFVKDYYNTKYSNDNNQSVLIKYKDIIAITEFKKISNDRTQIAELMVFYVENGVKYTDCYGDINQQFYLSMESMYERALEFITDNGLLAKFNARCLKIVNDTSDMGWGFHDQLCEIYYSFNEV